MKIDVSVQEVLSRTISVDAESIEDAVSKVEEMYYNEDIVLDYNDFNGNVVFEKKEDNFDCRKDMLIDKMIKYMIKEEKKHYEESNFPHEHIYLTLKELQELFDKNYV